jgi:hypothetical protein
VRRALTWLAGAVGLAALARLLRRRAAGAAPPADPAEELRERLAEQRRQEGPAADEEIVAPEPDPEPAGPAADTVDLEERRARVHARAQEAIELMSDVAPEDEPEGDATA